MKVELSRAAILLSSIILLAGLPLATLAGPPDGGVEGPHGNVPGFGTNSCYVCHDIVIGSTGRDAVRSPNETCFGCHTDGPTYGTGDPYIEDRPRATPVGNHANLVTGSTRFTYGEFGSTWPFVEFEQEIHCTTCHDPHRTFDPADPDPSTNNIMYIRDHTDDWQVTPTGSVIWVPTKQIKVIDNTQTPPVEIIKVVDQDIVYTQTADLADGLGQMAAETNVCEVCHTLTDHHQVDDTAPGGQSHFDGEDCTACHSHPAGFAPAADQPLTGPHAAFGDPDCGSCHDSSFFPGGPDNLAGLPSVFCATCHDPATVAGLHAHTVSGSTRFDYSLECTACHDQHGWSTTNVDGNPNLDYIKATINESITVTDNTRTPPVQIDKTITSDIVFDSLDDFADGDALYDRDICVACHTLTYHHQNDGTAPLGQSHFDGEDCTACHTHPSGFAPSGGNPLTGPHATFGDPNCGSCHESTFFPGGPDNPGGLASVFCATCHDPATVAGIHSHTVTGSTRFQYSLECTICHDQHGWDTTNVDGNPNLAYIKGTIQEQFGVVDLTQTPPVQVITTVDSHIVFDSPDDFANGDALYGRDICVTCHTLTNHHQSDGDAPGGQSHFDGETCTSCHQHPEGFRPPGGLAGPPVQGPHADIPGFTSGDCLVCHSLYPTVEQMQANSTEVCRACHSEDWTIVAATPEHEHASAITGSTQFDYGVECAACHAPHGWQSEVGNAEGTENIRYVRANIDELIAVVDQSVDPPETIIKEIDHNVVFTDRSGPGSFADGDANYTEDVCNTCHTLTAHHQNDGTAPGDQSHFDGEACTNCHLHPEGFGGFAGPHPQAVTDCSNCHLGADGEPDLTGIHGNECERCHPSGYYGTFLGPTGTWSGECRDCHNPGIDETGNLDEHRKGHRCVVCHTLQMTTANAEEIHLYHTDKANCVVCHGFIPDLGIRIGSGDRTACEICHTGGESDDLRGIHERHTKARLSCHECHNGERPPVDIVAGPAVGGTTRVCEICHEDRSRNPQRMHKKHTGERLDCGSCHADATLQDDRAPMPPIDDSRRAMLSRGGVEACVLCHRRKTGEARRTHDRHVPDLGQWCYNCHAPEDLRPIGGAPPVLEPAQSCGMCHRRDSYTQGTPFEVHLYHSGVMKCYVCHQADPRLFDWPTSWLGELPPPDPPDKPKPKPRPNPDVMTP